MGEKKRRMQAGGPSPSGAIPPNQPPVGVPDLIVRPCFEPDLEQVTVIYHHHVMTGTGTFDLDPPDLAAMRERWAKVVSNGWPFLVACAPQQFSRVLGYAYAQPFRERKAYAQTFEDSVYVAPYLGKRGVGTALLDAVLKDLAQINARQVLAVIGDADNAPSIGLHRKLGFQDAGRLHAVGHKFGRWLDVVLMQRALDPLGAQAQQ